MLHDGAIQVRAIYGLVLALALLTGCNQPGTGQISGPSPAPPLPEVDLSTAEPVVREHVQSERKTAVKRLQDTTAAGSSKADAIGRLGLVYLTYTFNQAAETCFLQASELDTGSHSWTYAAAYVAELEGRSDSAVSRLKEAIERAPTDLPSRLRLANILLEQGEVEQAHPHLEQALKIAPGSAAGLFGMARVLAARGEHEQAVSLFETVLEAQPRALSVYQALGLSLRQLGETQRAARALDRGGDSPVMFDDPVLRPTAELGRSASLYLERASGLVRGRLYPEAAADLARAIELQPESLEARRTLAFCLQQSGDLAGAIATMQAGLELGRSTQGELTSEEQAEIWLVLGRLWLESGDQSTAERCFRDALERAPDLPEGHFLLGNLLARSGRLDQAISHFDAVLQARPQDADMLTRRATALINLGRNEDAKRDLASARRLAEAPELRLRIAAALEHLGEGEAARSLREEAREDRQGTAGQPGELAALMDRARAHLAAGDLDAAEARLRAALRIEPQSLQAHLQLAGVLGHQGRLSEAAAHFEAVIELQPTNPAARRGLVTALLLEERFVEARAALESGLRALPRDRALALALARLLSAAPDQAARDGAAAVRAAEALVGAGTDPTIHDRLAAEQTLAMAQAEAGRLELAASIQDNAVRIAEENGLNDPGGLRRQRLEAYRQGRPWRLGSPTEILDELFNPDQGRP